MRPPESEPPPRLGTWTAGAVGERLGGNSDCPDTPIARKRQDRGLRPIGEILAGILAEIAANLDGAR